ncbi:hypothetical protein Tco_0319641 [Tanacetum coccineum]
MEAHCVNLELKYQNQALKEGKSIELEHKVAKLLKENKTLKRHYKELFDSIKTTRAKTIEHTTSLITKNDVFKAQLQEKGFAIATLKNELRKLTRNIMNTKFAKSSILRKPVLQPHRNQSVVRQPTAFKSERPRISKPRFSSQVDVNNDLSKPVTTHYLPKGRESAIAKPHNMIVSSNSRNSSKNMPRFSSNDMVHNHYLEEAKKKTQESSRNSRPGVMPSARSQRTANGSKPKPRINNKKSRNCPASKSSCVMTKIVPIAEHSRNSRNFQTPNILFARHVPSNQTTNRNKPIEQRSVAKKPERQIPKGHRFLIKKTSVVHEKTMTPRSCLRWKLTGKIFKTVSLRWIPIGKIFDSSTTKVDSEPTNGSDEDITNQYEYEQTLDVSACTLNLSACTSFNPKKEGLRVCSELGIHDHSNEPSSSKLVPIVVPPADKTTTSRKELEFLFHHHITMLSTAVRVDCEIYYESNLLSMERQRWCAFICEQLVPGNGIDDLNQKDVTILIHLITVLSALRRSGNEEHARSVNYLYCKRSYGTGANTKDGDCDASFQLKWIHYHMLMLNSTKDIYKHQIQESMKAQEIKSTKSSRANLDISNLSESSFGGDSSVKLSSMMQS